MITVKITEKDSDRYEYITFPVNKYSFYDQLDRARIFGEYTASLYDVSWGSYLKEIKLSDEPTIDEFNLLFPQAENG